MREANFSELMGKTLTENDRIERLTLDHISILKRHLRYARTELAKRHHDPIAVREFKKIIDWAEFELKK